MKQYSIAEARDQFTTLIRDVESEHPIEVTRRGQPVAVVLSIEEYRRLTAKGQSFWEAYERFRATYDLDNDGIPEDEFPAPRDRSPGREVDL
ncbi:MAG: type II toxin-antitoxin system Phd/YefM family antitoxin [Caldilineaceae bacterium]|nr:type II toxin-antitoxin system Phd/YefM family antitoxin [Caldilineaceae bacterium]